jgi:NAD(P)-dependent dehydrogenase (short-subunit alcohol dehydrogenase family)
MNRPSNILHSIHNLIYNIVCFYVYVDLEEAMRFVDKVCIVTGGASGIGRAACRKFADEGGLVSIVDKNEKCGHETLDYILSRSGRSIFTKADIAEPDEIKRSVLRTVKEWGRIDVLVNNAAIMTFDPVIDLPEDRWDYVFAVNLRAPYLYCKHSVPYMKSGAIVNVSSVHAYRSTSNVSSYAASKAGLEAFTRVLSLELDKAKIRVNAIAPGATDTPMLWSNPNLMSGVEPKPITYSSPEDIAAIICFLASEESQPISGSTVISDNGQLRRL